MTKGDRIQWTEAIEYAFRMLGCKGQVTIEDTDKHYRFRVHHSAFENPFTGEYPGIDDLFIVIIKDYQFKDDKGNECKHRESIMFDADTTAPLYYSICHGFEYQRVYISDGFVGRKKGDIRYANSCVSGRYRMEPLETLKFESDTFDLGTLIHNLTG